MLIAEKIGSSREGERYWLAGEYIGRNSAGCPQDRFTLPVRRLLSPIIQKPAQTTSSEIEAIDVRLIELKSLRTGKKIEAYIVTRGPNDLWDLPDWRYFGIDESRSINKF